MEYSITNIHVCVNNTAYVPAVKKVLWPCYAGGAAFGRKQKAV